MTTQHPSVMLPLPATLACALLQGDVPLVGRYDPTSRLLLVYPRSCAGVRVELLTKAHDLVIWHGGLVHAGPPGEHCDELLASLAHVCTRTREPQPLPRPCFHWYADSKAVHRPKGETDLCRCALNRTATNARARTAAPRVPHLLTARACLRVGSSHADHQSGTGYMPLSILKGRDTVVATKETLKHVLHEYGVAVLPGQEQLLLPTVVEEVQVTTQMAPSRSSKAERDPAKGWVPIFGKDTLRQMTTMGGWVSSFEMGVESVLHSCGVLEHDARGPYRGTNKCVCDAAALRCLLGAREQPAHADVSLKLMQYGV